MMSPHRAAEAPASGRRTILLVDDEPMLLKLGEAVLTRHGYEVLLAADGRQAVDCYRAAARPIDLVVLDRTMPRLTGREALRELRGLDPAVAVLFASGYAADQLTDEERAHTRGFLNKPYSPHDLLAAVRQSLAR